MGVLCLIFSHYRQGVKIQNEETCPSLANLNQREGQCLYVLAPIPITILYVTGTPNREVAHVLSALFSWSGCHNAYSSLRVALEGSI